jgi:hypothetical protein
VLVIEFIELLGRGNTKETGNRNVTAISENCYQPELEHMLLNGAALPFPQFALLHSVTCVPLRVITILGNCRCVVVALALTDS